MQACGRTRPGADTVVPGTEVLEFSFHRLTNVFAKIHTAIKHDVHGAECTGNIFFPLEQGVQPFAAFFCFGFLLFFFVCLGSDSL